MSMEILLDFSSRSKIMILSEHIFLATISLLLLAAEPPRFKNLGYPLLFSSDLPPFSVPGVMRVLVG
jgi:hypothetical protein